MPTLGFGGFLPAAPQLHEGGALGERGLPFAKRRVLSHIAAANASNFFIAAAWDRWDGWDR